MSAPIKIGSLVVFLVYFACFSPAVEAARGSNILYSDLATYRDRVKHMFSHAYDSYIHNAYPYDELRPLSCDGFDTWGSFSLTLIDALDTLAIMGNESEFRRVANLLIDRANFDIDVNVSVFETNIRVVGGLLSAHLLSRRMGMELEPGWPCSGPLLRLAENVARRPFPAFDTLTKMPYGTINLRRGVPKDETSVTCIAGVATYIVEFGTLTRLTGDPLFEATARKALESLWKRRSKVGLVGNHIDVQTGEWTAMDAGIGAGVDSYFEYLVKGAILFQQQELMDMFNEYYIAIQRFLNRDDWYFWASMDKGHITIAVFQSLEAFWPGLLSLVGKIDQAMKSLHNYHQVWKQFGFTPEFYNVPSADPRKGREGYPLRPELIESTMYLYRATRDPWLLQVGVDILESIEHSARTRCGYATIHNVKTHSLDNRMESFFLAETTKYLYLLFDPDNFIHNTGDKGTVILTPNGECVMEAGGYVFNTEAHPIDAGAVYCCSAQKHEDDMALQEFIDNIDLLSLMDLTDNTYKKMFRDAKKAKMSKKKRHAAAASHKSISVTTSGKTLRALGKSPARIVSEIDVNATRKLYELHFVNSLNLGKKVEESSFNTPKTIGTNKMQAIRGKGTGSVVQVPLTDSIKTISDKQPQRTEPPPADDGPDEKLKDWSQPLKKPVSEPLISDPIAKTVFDINEASMKKKIENLRRILSDFSYDEANYSEGNERETLETGKEDTVLSGHGENIMLDQGAEKTVTVEKDAALKDQGEEKAVAKETDAVLNGQGMKKAIATDKDAAVKETSHKIMSRFENELKKLDAFNDYLNLLLEKVHSGRTLTSTERNNLNSPKFYESHSQTCPVTDSPDIDGGSDDIIENSNVEVDQESVLSCPAQKFSLRMSVMGQFFDD